MTEKSTKEDGAEPDDFASMLATLKQGSVNKELSHKLGELVAAVKKVQKKGTLTVQLVVEPQKGNDEGITVCEAVKLTAPQYPRKSAYFFATDDGHLTKDHPSQHTFQFTEDRPAT